MTFYVRVQETKTTNPPKPEFNEDRCILEADNTKIKKGQTLKVKKGTTVYADFDLTNNGGKGRIAVQLWDTKNDEEVGWKDLGELDAGESFFGSFTFTADKNRDLIFVSWYYDESTGNWCQVDTVGCGEDEENDEDLVFGVDIGGF